MPRPIWPRNSSGPRRTTASECARCCSPRCPTSSTPPKRRDEHEEHYEDFLATTRFLLGDDDARVGQRVDALRRSPVLPPFVVHVKPVRVPQPDYGARHVAALVLVVEPGRQHRLGPERVATTLELTPVEARVAVCLAPAGRGDVLSSPAGRSGRFRADGSATAVQPRRIEMRGQLPRHFVDAAGQPRLLHRIPGPEGARRSRLRPAAAASITSSMRRA